MAQSGFTPVSLYYSATAAAVPVNTNLANGELALNTADMKLYAKNSAGTVTLLASNSGASGSVTSVAASVPAFLSVAGSPITTSGTLAITLSGTALPVANGGTGLITTPANGALDIGNGTGFTRTTLTAGSGITITNASGGITIAASGGGTVSSVAGAGTVNGLTLTGTVTTTGNLTLGGTLASVANSALTNSSVTVTAGTGMSGGGAVALGSSVTLTNAGVTSLVAGTGITVSGATGAVTVSSSATSALTLISTTTASSSATVDIVLSGSYSQYLVVLNNLTLSSSGNDLRMQWASGGSFATISQFTTDVVLYNPGTGPDGFYGNNDGAMAKSIDGTSSYGLSGQIYIFNPSSTTNRKQFTHQLAYWANTGYVYAVNGGGDSKSTTAIYGLRFYISTGNIAAGTFKLYGIT